LYSKESRSTTKDVRDVATIREPPAQQRNVNAGKGDMEAFEYSALPARVVFGFGTLPRVVDELSALGRKRAFVLSDLHHAAAGAGRLMQALDKLGVQLSADAVMHTPVDVTERVMARLVALDAGAIGMSLHHKLCHVLGGTFNLPHAETHTVILPHAAAYNAGVASAAHNRVARAWCA
jgi:alcohol dehydrogenase class IV